MVRRTSGSVLYSHTLVFLPNHTSNCRSKSVSTPSISRNSLAMNDLQNARDGRGKRRRENAAVGNDGGDEGRRGDVEGGVGDGDTLGYHGYATEPGDFITAALLDGYRRAVGSGRIQCRDGRKNIKRNTEMLGEHRQPQSTHLVGHIAVGGHTVAAHEHRLHRTRSQHRGR